MEVPSEGFGSRSYIEKEFQKGVLFKGNFQEGDGGRVCTGKAIRNRKKDLTHGGLPPWVDFQQPNAPLTHYIWLVQQP